MRRRARRACAARARARPRRAARARRPPLGRAGGRRAARATPRGVGPPGRTRRRDAEPPGAGPAGRSRAQSCCRPRQSKARSKRRSPAPPPAARAAARRSPGGSSSAYAAARGPPAAARRRAARRAPGAGARVGGDEEAPVRDARSRRARARGGDGRLDDVDADDERAAAHREVHGRRARPTAELHGPQASHVDGVRVAHELAVGSSGHAVDGGYYYFVPPLDGSREAAILRALGKGLLSPAAGVYASTYRGAVSVVSVSLGTLDPRCTPLARDRSPAGSFRSVEHIATRPAIPQSA